jgi:hypothetical protein
MASAGVSLKRPHLFIDRRVLRPANRLPSDEAVLRRFQSLEREEFEVSQSRGWTLTQLVPSHPTASRVKPDAETL